MGSENKIFVLILFIPVHGCFFYHGYGHLGQSNNFHSLYTFNALVICNHGPHPLRGGGRSLAVFLLFDCPCSAG